MTNEMGFEKEMKQDKSQDTYRHIRQEDRANLEAVLKTFERNGVAVSLGGSAAERRDYNDIDLRVQEHSPMIASKNKQSGLHNSLCELAHRYGASIRDVLKGELRYLQLGKVDERYKIVMGNTEFDIVKGKSDSIISRPGFLGIFQDFMGKSLDKIPYFERARGVVNEKTNENRRNKTS